VLARLRASSAGDAASGADEAAGSGHQHAASEDSAGSQAGSSGAQLPLDRRQRLRRALQQAARLEGVRELLQVCLAATLAG
jgi:hypothetical protein